MITPSFGLTATERVLPKLALDFTTASLDGRVTFTRSGDTATVVNSSGYIESALANTPRFDYTLNTGGACKGLLIEEARNNSALYSSDLTQTSAWTVNAVTAAKTATGPDNVANSATTITASSAHGLVFQKLTAASAARVTSVYLKRRSGTGKVAVSQGQTTGSTLVTNGDFATGDLTGWGVTSGVGTWAVVSNKLVCSAATSNSNYADQAISGFTIGKLYVLQATVVADSNPSRGGSITIRTGSSTGTVIATAWSPANGLGTFNVPFVAHATTMYISVQQFTSVSRTYDDFSLFELVSTEVTSDIASNWYRAVATPGTLANPTLIVQVSGNGESVDVFGMQCEAGAFATSYIPTTTAALTRNADVATMTGANFSDWWKATTGSVLIRSQQRAVSGTRPWLQFDDGTADNIIALRGNTTNPELYIKATTDQVQIDAGTIAANTNYGLASAWNTDNCSAAINGGSPVTDTSAIIPTVTRARLGCDDTNYLNGWLGKIIYWPQRITDAEVQAFSKYS